MVKASKRLLNPSKNLPSQPLASWLGLSKIEHRAGLKVKALMAENNTEMAMVIANCWYKRPVIPGVKATGTNTAIKIIAIAITGPATSFMAKLVASRGLFPC